MAGDFFDDAARQSGSRPRPGTPAGLAGRLERIARHLDRDRSRALAGSGLTARDVEVLGALRRAGEPHRLSQGELAKATQLTSGGMTGQADRMERAGWVRRSADPDDRRGVLISLTDLGKHALEGSLKTYTDSADRAMEGLDPSERQALEVLLRKLLMSLEGEYGTEKSKSLG